MMDGATSKFWMSPALPGVECFRARDLVHHYQRHSHEAYSIGVIENGIGGNSCRGSTHRHPPGTIVAMNPDEAHTGYAVGNKPLSYRMFYVRPEVLRRIWFRDVGIKDPDCARELLDFHGHWEAFHDEFFTESAFTSLFGKLIERHAHGVASLRNPKEPRAVRLIKEYLEARYTQGAKLADLVDLTQLDRAYLIRIFRGAVGMPPHRYLIQIRVRHAKRLIGEGRPLTEVAAETGFADQSHLTRHFKSLTGLTPGRYAQQVTFVQDNR